METVAISAEILHSLKQVVSAELAYEQATDCGRKFGITGEVGEILVCQALGLRLVKDPRSAGFDAIDNEGRKVQIKTRRAEFGEMPKNSGRLSAFSGHDFDYALMGILDRNYLLKEIWRCEAAILVPIISKHKRRNPTLREFRASGRGIS